MLASRPMTDSDPEDEAMPRGALAVRVHEQFQDDHDAQRALCVELEQFADMLPGMPPPARVRRICAQIECVTSNHFRRAEALLRDLAAASGDPSREEMLQSLAEMHALDAVHGQDLIAVLWDSVARGAVEHPGELGYMLRCFFDGCYRAIAFKESLALLFEGAERDRS